MTHTETDDIIQFHSCEYPLEWRGCYDKDRKYAKYITDESFAHPAKMSWGLLERIFKHLRELNLITPDTIIVDFMAGTFRTGIMAELFGYRSIGIELEPHFITMIEGNRGKMETQTGHKTRMEFLQGDARQLSGMLKEKGYCGVVSPPYADIREGGRLGKEKVSHDSKHRLTNEGMAYSDNPANIGNLPNRRLVGITSPPYESADNMFHDIEWMNKIRPRPSNPKIISETKNNIEKARGESYLQAMSKVYSEAYRSGISPLVLVTKNPTRSGALRRLDLDTAALLHSVGYEIFDYHRAILFEEQSQATLDGEIFKKPKGRLSFFKRLLYQKGNAVAKWEDIIFARIPNRQGNMTGITSPPYSEAQTGGGIAIKGYQGKHIHEMGKNQPDKVGDRCGYMKVRHGMNPANIGNLPDKENA